MRKSAYAFAITLMLIAGPVLAMDQSDDRPPGLRAAIALVFGLFGQGERSEVERTAPDMHEKTGLELIVEGSAPPSDDRDNLMNAKSEAIDG